MRTMSCASHCRIGAKGRNNKRSPIASRAEVEGSPRATQAGKYTRSSRKIVWMRSSHPFKNAKEELSDVFWQKEHESLKSSNSLVKISATALFNSISDLGYSIPKTLRFQTHRIEVEDKVSCNTMKRLLEGEAIGAATE